MILTGLKIKSEVYNGNIHIKPFLEDNLNPNSYNYRLNNKLLEISEDVINPFSYAKCNEITLTDAGYRLDPKKVYLGSTIEEIGSDNYVTQLIGRSSVGRLGLFLQITAPLGHIGSKHCWTLELKSVQPLIIYPNMKIGQVSFWCVEGQIRFYNGKYNLYNEPHISEFSKELTNE